jgi:hypothetical protein
MINVVTIAIGMALLVISLAARHADAPALVAWSSWGGSVLVIVGVGRVIFLT